MISGKVINLRLYQDEKDVLAELEMYNHLAERMLTDHTEIYPPNKCLQRFRETGFWEKDNGKLLVTSKADTIVGMISFVRKTEFELGIGYRMYRSEDRDQGYMTEALQLFSAYLFETVPYVTRLMIVTAHNNVSSRKLAEKCGYVQEGVLRRAYYYRGEMCDWVIYSMLREESPQFEALLERES
jgi:RimJ/RimL family protein N-acetyltransferase